MPPVLEQDSKVDSAESHGDYKLSGQDQENSESFNIKKKDSKANSQIINNSKKNTMQ